MSRGRSGDLPLEGQRILVTRRREQAGALVAGLEALGATVAQVPAIRIVTPEDTEALDTALRGLKGFDWLLLTSGNAVLALAARLAALGVPLESVGQGPRIGCVGPQTARKLRGCFAGVRVHAQPEIDYRGEALAAAVLQVGGRALEAAQAPGAPASLAGQRVLIPTSDRARSRLRDELAAAGAEVQVVAAYRTVPVPGLRESLLPLEGRLDLVLFASPSAVAAVVDAVPEMAAGLPAGVIGPVTETAARRAGFHVRAVAAISTVEGLVEAIQGRRQS